MVAGDLQLGDQKVTLNHLVYKPSGQIIAASHDRFPPNGGE